MKNGWTHCLWHCRSSMETGLPDALDFSAKAKMVLVKMCKHGDTCSLGGCMDFLHTKRTFPKWRIPGNCWNRSDYQFWYMKKLSKLYFEKRTLEKPPNSNSNMALICLPVVSQAGRGPISRRSASGRQLHQAYNEFGEPGTETWTFQLFLASRGEPKVSIFKISQPKTVDDIFWYAGPFHHMCPPQIPLENPKATINGN